MGTIADKLQYLKETKNLIKQALIEQGVEVTESDTFRSYAQKVKSIETGVKPTGEIEITENGNYDVTNYASAKVNVGGGSTPYQRPSDWLTIPTMDGTKDEVYVLNGVIKNGLNMIFIGLSGIGTIDWGDGTTESFNVSSETSYSHHFNYDDLSELSWTNHNRSKQALIHIYGDRGAITVVNFAKRYSYTNADGRNVAYNPDSSSDIFEVKADVEKCDYTFSIANSLIKHLNIEIFDWKGKQNKSNMRYMFYNCYSLQSIPQLDTSNVTNMASMFGGCYSLQSIPQLDTSNVTIMASMFNKCHSLQMVPQLYTSKVTDMSYMFSNCYSLQSIPQLDTSKVTNMDSMFYNCYSLQMVPQMDTRNVTNMSNMFSACPSLQMVPQLDTSKVTNMSNMFYGCSSLQMVPQLDTSNVTNMGSMFYNCYSLLNIQVYNAGASTKTTVTLSGLSNSQFFTKQALVDLFNSVAPNNVEGHTRTLQLGALQDYLADCYVKDSGIADTYILPTRDTEIQSGKTYYIYNEITNTYSEVTPDFTTNTFYYELVTASWNKYIICESTDENAMLALDYARNIKGWTIS